MLTNSVGSFRNLAPQARVDDGKIWLGIFKDFNYLDLIKVIPEFLSGQPLTSELMTLKALEEVRIELLSDHPFRPIWTEILARLSPSILRFFHPSYRSTFRSKQAKKEFTCF